jgi:anaerobic magnesium-protoporphyrin IX monomethyl ester cyclase
MTAPSYPIKPVDSEYSSADDYHCKNSQAMRVLLIEAPSRDENDAPPFGLLYAGSVAFRLGHHVKIVDLANESPSLEQICSTIESFQPDMIGFGGITSSYRALKALSIPIKRFAPQIPLVVGGVIASIPELLLEKASVDIVVQGEAETIFPHLLNYLAKKCTIDKVPGISFKKGGLICRNPLPHQFEQMDDIPFPEYSLLNMDFYLTSAESWLRHYRPDGSDRPLLERLSGKKLFPIISSRGCTHVCYFCYRHVRGLRQHSPAYTVRHMLYLHENFGVGLFQFNDELTTASKEWILEFCHLLMSSQMNILFIVLSARVDNVDEEMVIALKQAGCVMLNFGYETGSQQVMEQVRKGTTIAQAVTAGMLTKKHGLINIPEIIIGFPVETEETIGETIDFLKTLNTIPISVNYPLPFPKTMLWKYAIKMSLIDDEEAFILGYSNASDLRVNLTAYPDSVVMVFFHYYLTRRKYIKCIYYLVLYRLMEIHWLVQVVRLVKSGWSRMYLKVCSVL